MRGLSRWRCKSKATATDHDRGKHYGNDSLIFDFLLTGTGMGMHRCGRDLFVLNTVSNKQYRLHDSNEVNDEDGNRISFDGKKSNCTQTYD